MRLRSVIEPRSAQPKILNITSRPTPQDCEHGNYGCASILPTSPPPSSSTSRSLAMNSPRHFFVPLGHDLSHTAFFSRRHRLPRCSTSLCAAWGLLVAAVFLRPASAVRIPFDNCLPNSYRLSDPAPLQWEPLWGDALFETDTDNHNLQVIIWGNVSGSHLDVTLPPPNDTHWEDDDKLDGKIARVPDPRDPSLTTLVTQIDMLTYREYRDNADFCRSRLVNGSCPLAPIFDDTV